MLRSYNPIYEWYCHELVLYLMGAWGDRKGTKHLDQKTFILLFQCNPCKITSLTNTPLKIFCKPLLKDEGYIFIFFVPVASKLRLMSCWIIFHRSCIECYLAANDQSQEDCTEKCKLVDVTISSKEGWYIRLYILLCLWLSVGCGRTV